MGTICNSCCGKCLRNMKSEGIQISFGSNYNTIPNNKNENENEEKIDVREPIGFTFSKSFPTAMSNIEEISKIRNIERVVYTICQCGSYNLLVFTVGIAFSLVWGLLLGGLEFLNLWIFNPLQEMFTIVFEAFGKMCGGAMDNIFGQCLRNLKGERPILNFVPDIKKDDRDIDRGHDHDPEIQLQTAMF